MPNLKDSQEEWAQRLIGAINRADHLTSALPVSMPGPLRDHYFATAVAKFMEQPHRAIGCPECMGRALQMAQTTLNWFNPAAEGTHPSEPAARMALLTRQIDLALEYLERSHYHAGAI